MQINHVIWQLPLRMQTLTSSSLITDSVNIYCLEESEEEKRSGKERERVNADDIELCIKGGEVYTGLFYISASEQLCPNHA